MNGRAGLEVAADSLASALAAQAGGAMRVELCGGLADGGLTPSAGTLEMARERLHIPLFVLVRPRTGDFVYADDEIQTMCRDIAQCRRLQCDGVVIGAVRPAGGVDLDACRRLMAAAGDMQCTFHRAFDTLADPERALEAIIGLGCHRLLTSGGAARAFDGRQRIATLVGRAAGRIVVMPGGGIEAGHLAQLRDTTGAREFHASARRPVAWRGPGADFDGMGAARLQTDAATVRTLVDILEVDAGPAGQETAAGRC